MLDLLHLAQQCAPLVAPKTLAALVQVETHANPYAIGVVGGHLVRQPKTKAEALAAVKSLDAQGYNYSLGIAQVNKYNLPKYKLSVEQAFNPCKNLSAGSKILHACYTKAKATRSDQAALKAAFSCYYSGNFKRGFIPDKPGVPSYVSKILAVADAADSDSLTVKPIAIVPDIKTTGPKPQADRAQGPVKLKRQINPSTQTKGERQIINKPTEQEPINPTLIF